MPATLFNTWNGRFTFKLPVAKVVPMVMSWAGLVMAMVLPLNVNEPTFRPVPPAMIMLPL